MILKNREIIERVQALYSKGVASDDTRMSKRHIYSVVCSAKSLIVKRELDKRRRVSDFNFDYLECVPMTEAEAHDCPCAPPSGCLIMKSECQLPDTVTYKYGGYIAGVTSIDGSLNYSKTTWETKQYKTGSKYTNKTPDYFIKNKYLYITTPKKVKGVTVKGLFHNLTTFNCSICDGQTVNTCESYLDKPFTIEPDLIDVVVQLAFEQLVKPFIAIQQDDAADTKDR